MRALGDRLGEAAAIGSLATTRHDRGRTAEALELARRHLALARETASRDTEAHALITLGSLAILFGDPLEASRHLYESLAIFRETPVRTLEDCARRLLAESASERADVAGALRLAEEALAAGRASGIAPAIVDASITAGQIRALGGDVPGARAALEEALATARAEGYAARAAVCLALLADLAGGDADAARTALSQTRGGSTFGESILMHFAVGRATRDRALLGEAKRALDELVLHAPPEHRESMLTNVRLHREIVAAAREAGLGDPPQPA
jgi:tetratricopeptide (TPR) repeat protein